MAKLITSPAELTPSRLTSLLLRQGVLKTGRAVEVNVISSSQTPWSDITHLEAAYSPDAPASAPRLLFLKTGKGGAGEIAFYRLAAGKLASLPVPPCYDAAYSKKEDRSHLLLKDLSETHSLVAPWPLPPLLEQGQAVARSLARLHAGWWEDPGMGRTAGGLQWNLLSRRHYQETLAWWQEKYAAFAEFLGDRFFPEERRIYAQALALMPRLWDAYWRPRLATLKGFTLIHGDAHPGNLLYPLHPEEDPIYLVDWQGIRFGKGSTDLAYMVTYHWYPERERAMPFLESYFSALIEYGVQDYDWDSFWLDYQVSVASYLFDPVRLFAHDVSPDVWWPIFRKGLAAFVEFDCTELLSSATQFRLHLGPGKQGS